MKLLKSDWFSRDKPFHGWLHSMVVRAMRSYTVFPLEKVILISVMGGIVYEIGDLIYHCAIKKELTFKEYVKDSLRDLCWNIAGTITGLVI